MVFWIAERKISQKVFSLKFDHVGEVLQKHQWFAQNKCFYGGILEEPFCKLILSHFQSYQAVVTQTFKNPHSLMES